MRQRWPWVLAAAMGCLLWAPVDAAAQQEEEPEEVEVDDEEVEVEVDEIDATDLAGRSLGAFAGINIDDSDLLLGVDARWTFELSEEVAPWFALALNPALTWQFVDAPVGGSAQGFQIDVNGLVKFALIEQVIPYLGVGLSYFINRQTDADEITSTSTDANLNLLVGGAKIDVNQPFDVFGQFRITNRTVGSALTFMGGISADF